MGLVKDVANWHKAAKRILVTCWFAVRPGELHIATDLSYWYKIKRQLER